VTCEIQPFAFKVLPVLASIDLVTFVDFRVTSWLVVLILECTPHQIAFPLLPLVHFPPLVHSLFLLFLQWILNQAQVPLDYLTVQPPCSLAVSRDSLACHLPVYHQLKCHMGACSLILAGLVLIQCLGYGMTIWDLSTCSSKD